MSTTTTANVRLSLSRAAYEEIITLLQAAGRTDVILTDGAIDMNRFEVFSHDFPKRENLRIQENIAQNQRKSRAIWAETEKYHQKITLSSNSLKEHQQALEAKLDTRVYTTGQVAKIMRMSPRMVAKCFDNKTLKGYLIPGGQARRVLHRDLKEFMIKHNVPLEFLETTSV